MSEEEGLPIVSEVTFSEGDRARSAAAKVLSLAGFFNSEGDIVLTGKKYRRVIRAAAQAAKVSVMVVMDWVCSEEFVDYVISFELRQTVKLFTAVTRRGLGGDMTAAKFALKILNPEKFDTQLVRERKKEGWLDERGLVGGDVTNNLIIAIQTMGDNPLAKKLLESVSTRKDGIGE